MKLHLDANSSKPIYRQIVDQIRVKIAAGELRGRTRLPSIRELAFDLGVNANTVARCFQELEREGFVVSRPGHGVFAIERPPKLPAAHQQRQITPHLDELLVAAWKLGIDPSELVQLLEQRAIGFFPEEDPDGPADRMQQLPNN